MNDLAAEYKQAMREPGMITGQRVKVEREARYSSYCERCQLSQDVHPGGDHEFVRSVLVRSVTYRGRVVAWVVVEYEVRAIVELDGGFRQFPLGDLQRDEEVQSRDWLPAIDPEHQRFV